MSKTAKDHWAHFHNTKRAGALSGTAFKRVVELFSLDVRPGMDVLNIGVGLGHCTRGFVAAGCNMYVMDICEEAVNKVANVTSGSFLHEKSSELPDSKFDLIYSFLVTQHMSEDDILLQFPNVIRSLKPGGKFYVQFAGSDRPGENNNPNHIVGKLGDKGVSILGGRMVRSQDYAIALVERCGGKVVKAESLKKFPQRESYWYYLVVQK